MVFLASKSTFKYRISNIKGSTIKSSNFLTLESPAQVNPVKFSYFPKSIHVLLIVNPCDL